MLSLAPSWWSSNLAQSPSPVHSHAALSLCRSRVARTVALGVSTHPTCFDAGYPFTGNVDRGNSTRIVAIASAARQLRRWVAGQGKLFQQFSPCSWKSGECGQHDDLAMGGVFLAGGMRRPAKVGSPPSRTRRGGWAPNYIGRDCWAIERDNIPLLHGSRLRSPNAKLSGAG